MPTSRPMLTSSGLRTSGSIEGLHIVRGRRAVDRKLRRRFALAIGQRPILATNREALARLLPQATKRWPDYCRNPRNQNLCGEIRLKQACGSHREDGFKLPISCAGACD